MSCIKMWQRASACCLAALVLFSSGCHSPEQQLLTIADARSRMRETLGTDFKRLEYLKQVNDNIREEELAHAREAISELDEKLAAARLRLDAIRVISAN